MFPWVRKVSWRRKWQLTPVSLLGKSHGQRSLAGYSSWGCKELEMTEYLKNGILGKLFLFGAYPQESVWVSKRQSRIIATRLESFSVSGNWLISASGCDMVVSSHYVTCTQPISRTLCFTVSTTASHTEHIRPSLFNKMQRQWLGVPRNNCSFCFKQKSKWRRIVKPNQLLHLCRQSDSPNSFMGLFLVSVWASCTPRQN